MSTVITYKRKGRRVRATGTIIQADPQRGLFKVKPKPKRWKAVWVSVTEIQQGAAIAVKPSQTPAAIIAQMVDGLRQLLERKAVTTDSIPLA